MTPAKMTQYVAMGCLVLMASAYLVYLAASWQMLSKEHIQRETHLNYLLDKAPRPSPAPNESPNADSSGSPHNGA